MLTVFTVIAWAITTFAASAAGVYAHRLHRLLHTDALTGLANRPALQRAFTQIQRHARRGELVGVLLCDVDEFKSYNDTHGHRFGDEVLRAIAADLAAATTGDELAVRLHGDEFAVLLPRLPEVRDAEGRARAFRAALAAPRLVDGRSVQVSVSIGAAVDTASVTTLSALLGHADTRMYGGKNTRRLTALPTPPATPTRIRDLPKEAA